MLILDVPDVLVAFILSVGLLFLLKRATGSHFGALKPGIA
jgi:hypothetical protein